MLSSDPFAYVDSADPLLISGGEPRGGRVVVGGRALGFMQVRWDGQVGELGAEAVAGQQDAPGLG